MNARQCWASVADGQRMRDEDRADAEEAELAETSAQMRAAVIDSLQGAVTEPAFVKVTFSATYPGGFKRLGTQMAIDTIHMRHTNDAVRDAFERLMNTEAAREYRELFADDYVAEHSEDVAKQARLEA